MFKSHLQAVNWCDVLHMVTLCLNENKLMANEEGFCKTGRGNLLDRSAPKWLYLGHAKMVGKPCERSTHATGVVWGIWCFTETSEIKWFPVNCLELLSRKRSAKHMVNEAVWCLPLHFFLNKRRRQGRSTFSIHHRPHYHYHHPHNHHHH